MTQTFVFRFYISILTISIYNICFYVRWKNNDLFIYLYLFILASSSHRPHTKTTRYTIIHRSGKIRPSIGYSLPLKYIYSLVLVFIKMTQKSHFFSILQNLFTYFGIFMLSEDDFVKSRGEAAHGGCVELSVW